MKSIKSKRKNEVRIMIIKMPITSVTIENIGTIDWQYAMRVILYCTIQYNTIQYNTIQYNTIQHRTIQHNTIQYNTIQCNTNKIIQYNTPHTSTTMINRKPIQHKKIIIRTYTYALTFSLYSKLDAFFCKSILVT